MPIQMLRGLAILLSAFAATAGQAPHAYAAGPAAQTAEAGQAGAERAKLIEYQPGQTDLAALAAGEGKTVVFFFASWCPNCILTLSELSEKWSDVSPEITLVIADYDTETELKARYGVTYQDTFVLLDDKSDGVRLWNAGGVAGLNENTR